MHRDDPEGCYGEGGGRGVHVWERMYTRGGFMSMYGKTNLILINSMHHCHMSFLEKCLPPTLLNFRYLTLGAFPWILLAN